MFAHNASGVLVHVSEVPRGKACDCYCAACGSPVIAKKGNRTVWHFAHLSKAACLHAPETALHKAVKQVILQGTQIGLPDLVVEARARVGRHEAHAERRVKGRAIRYFEPRLEVRMSDIVADAVIKADGRELIVEVAVTHKVDDEKHGKLALLRTPAIELEAWKLDRDVDWSSIRSFVSQSIEARKWVFNPLPGQLVTEAQAGARARATALADAAAREARSLEATAIAARSTLAPGLCSDWQVDATSKLKRLWSRYRSDRLLAVTLHSLPQWCANSSAQLTRRQNNCYLPSSLVMQNSACHLAKSSSPHRRTDNAIGRRSLTLADSPPMPKALAHR